MKEVLMNLWEMPQESILLGSLIAIVVFGIMFKAAEISTDRKNKRMIKEIKRMR